MDYDTRDKKRYIRASRWVKPDPDVQNPTRYYAVSRGRRIGIFTDFAKYERATQGFKGARSKSFKYYKQARRWLYRELFAKPGEYPLERRQKKELARRRSLSSQVKDFIRTLYASRIYAVDVEMTDLYSDGEILQVSIINGRNAVIYNQYFKPEHQTEWDDTVPIHHITPERVQDAPSFSSYAPLFSKLFAQAQLIVGYNTMQDVRMLQQAGVAFPPALPILDAGEAYSFIHSEHQPVRSYAKLKDCAAHYGYGETQWHDSLADAAATLYCFQAMLDDENALFQLFHANP